MTQKFISCPLLIASLLAIVSGFASAGCGKQPAPATKTAQAEPAPASDPLRVVLTPLAGDKPADLEIRELQGKIKTAPERNQLLERLGWDFVAKARLTSDPGFYTLAEQAAKAIRQTAPNDPAAALLLGHVSDALHRFADAEAIARQLVAEREFVFDYALLGDALMEQGKLTEAVQAYQKMVDLKPCLQTYSRIAHVRWLKGDLAGALEASRAAVSAGSPREPEPTAWACTRLASYELQARDFRQASTNLDVALQLAPEYAPALLWRGKLLLAQGKNAEAVEPLRRAAELSPLPDYLWTLAEALHASGQNADAVEAKLAASGAATDPRTYSLFLASKPSEPERALQLAKAELKTRQDVFTYDTLAWAQLASGQVNEAEESIGRALAEGTKDARIFFHAGTIAAAAGDSSRALEFLNRARASEQTLLPSEREALGQRLTAATTAAPQLSVNNQSNQPTQTTDSR